MKSLDSSCLTPYSMDTVALYSMNTVALYSMKNTSLIQYEEH